MTTAEKIKRGEEILHEYEQLCIEHGADYPGYAHAASILHAVSENTHDVPIPRRKICIALADADFEGKEVRVVPDPKTTDRTDGWRFLIEIV